MADERAIAFDRRRTRMRISAPNYISASLSARFVCSLLVTLSGLGLPVDSVTSRLAEQATSCPFSRDFTRFLRARVVRIFVRGAPTITGFSENHHHHQHLAHRNTGERPVHASADSRLLKLHYVATEHARACTTQDSGYILNYTGRQGMIFEEKHLCNFANTIQRPASLILQQDEYLREAVT